MLYIRDLEKAKVEQGGVPDRQQLAEARKDLDKVVAVRPCLRTHLQMAQVNKHTKKGADNMNGTTRTLRLLCFAHRCTTTWAWTPCRRASWWTRQR